MRLYLKGVIVAVGFVVLLILGVSAKWIVAAAVATAVVDALTFAGFCGAARYDPRQR